MDTLAIYRLYRDATIGGSNTSPSSLGGSGENNTQTSSGDAAAKKEQNPSSASGQDEKIYFCKYRGRLVSAETVSRLSPVERTLCTPFIERLSEKSSPTKSDNEGSEVALGFKGTVCGERMSFCRWDATISDVDFHQCCIIAMNFAPAA